MANSFESDFDLNDVADNVMNIFLAFKRKNEEKENKKEENERKRVEDERIKNENERKKEENVHNKTGESIEDFVDLDNFAENVLNIYLANKNHEEDEEKRKESSKKVIKTTDKPLENEIDQKQNRNKGVLKHKPGNKRMKPESWLDDLPEQHSQKQQQTHQPQHKQTNIQQQQQFQLQQQLLQDRVEGKEENFSWFDDFPETLTNYDIQSPKEKQQTQQPQNEQRNKLQQKQQQLQQNREKDKKEDFSWIKDLPEELNYCLQPREQLQHEQHHKEEQQQQFQQQLQEENFSWFDDLPEALTIYDIHLTNYDIHRKFLHDSNFKQHLSTFQETPDDPSDNIENAL
ncbi:hypothetical protein HELRODRAFT_174045 [Helobdella robusta]|uniref:Uncharacterized protein n=1 Tax=Helobdella robusta TaxID=6412 RepID=T1F7I9_HELRO|nr:hypothetical protein HELRODRAFT_174045 [Helobdella robusta]ESO03152.1 hypothetical protein HELRODRAFT_174045 [Helobdella robusta]